MGKLKNDEAHPHPEPHDHAEPNPHEPVGGDEAFSAVTLTRESPRTYGGQVLAQAIMAANSTVTDKVLHSIHAYFLRPGDITKELIFTSQRLNDGRSFATRRVQALQDDIPIFLCDRIIPSTRPRPRAHGCYDAAGPRP